MLALLFGFIISNVVVSSFAQTSATTDGSTTITTGSSGTTLPVCPEFCTLSPEPGGRGKAPFRMWYFNPETHECKHFRYTGRNGNKNRFRKRVDCESSCKTCVLTGSSAEAVDEDSKSETCSQPQSQGNVCQDSSPALTWYFDSDKKICQPFVYYGCGGNENRFESEPDCKESCS